MRKVVPCILAIDDLADRSHDVDILVDQNYFPAESDRYASLVPDSCELLLGPRYALLPPRFVQDYVTPPTFHSPPRVLVYFGAADQTGATARTLRAIVDADLEITAVFGPWISDASEAAGIASTARNVVCLPSGSGFHRLLATTDMAIGAGGVTTWERCYFGLPTVVMAVAENQESGARILGDAGVILYLGRSPDVTERTIRAAIDTLIASRSLTSRLRTASRALVDGLGAERVANRMLGSRGVTLRPATIADAEMSYEWRNDPATRRHFFDATAISREEHDRWWSESLNSPSRRLLVAELGAAGIGVLRFDLCDNEAEVSVYVRPSEVGRALGTQILRCGTKWARDALPGIQKLVARIRTENARSVAAFLSAGYHRHHEVLAFSLTRGTD
jgi:spore coat polysaccharide biosynthesis predicted glycosyltransferase SpsG/L-amino acid N-acyltransferase YncA